MKNIISCRQLRNELNTQRKMSQAALVPHALVQFLFLGLLIVANAPTSNATEMSMVQTVNDMWSALATRAAKETIAAVRKNSKIELELRTVPMDTFQVLVGRQHNLGLEVEGVTYNLLLGNEQEAVQEARKRATAAAAAAAAADAADTKNVASQASQTLPAGALLGPIDAGTTTAAVPAVSSSIPGEAAPLQLFSGPRSIRSLELPETTLAGPLELLLPVLEPVSIYSPLAADVGGPVRRVVIDTGVTVRVAGLRRVSLRRPLDLPRLPGQYLAEVYAQVAMGEAEEGFSSAPGVVYLADQLRKAAESFANSSSHGGRSGGKGQGGSSAAVLSLEVETVEPGALTLTSAPELPPPYSAAAAPRLKVRRLAGATVELSLRQGQLTPADTFNSAALSRVWAWPLPHIDSSSWLPYETLLRSVLASHPFNIDSVIRRGIRLRLTKSSIQGMHLIAFDMEVRARAPRPPEMEGSPYEWNETPLEIWEVVVQVEPQQQMQAQAQVQAQAPAASEGVSGGASNGAASEGFRFVPLHAKRKQSFQNTLTISRSALIMALTGGLNVTLGGNGDGYDQMEVGLAANAP